MKEIVVKRKAKRIDKYLSEETEYSRSKILKMIEQSSVLKNGKKVKPSESLEENDVITLIEKVENEIDIVPEKMDIPLLYEDDDLLVIDKPSGLVVHPGAGNKQGTLVNGLVSYVTLSHLEDKVRPGIVHRIDKDTSGLMIVAKSDKAHEILAEDFKNKRIHRTYLALLCGVFPHNDALIDAPIGRDKTARKKMAVTEENSKRAITHLHVEKRYQDFTLVRLTLETGRTHQIRVHMKYIGYPVYNDPVYTNKNASSFGQFLHSSTLDFVHPITKKEMHFTSPLPKEFQDFLTTLEHRENK